MSTKHYKLVDDRLCAQLVEAARTSPRKRSHHNLHQQLDDTVQRLCIGMHSGSYLRPHRHSEDYRWEMMLIIRGTLRMVLFDNDGRLLEKVDLSNQQSKHAIEIPPNTWHTLLPLGGEAIFMEIKQGPYTPLTQQDFADWAPQEGDADVDTYLHWFEHGTIGSYYPGHS